MRTSDERRAMRTSDERRVTVRSDVMRVTVRSDVMRVTGTSDERRVTGTSDERRVTVQDSSRRRVTVQDSSRRRDSTAGRVQGGGIARQDGYREAGLYPAGGSRVSVQPWAICPSCTALGTPARHLLPAVAVARSPVCAGVH